ASSFVHRSQRNSLLQVRNHVVERLKFSFHHIRSVECSRQRVSNRSAQRVRCLPHSSNVTQRHRTFNHLPLPDEKVLLHWIKFRLSKILKPVMENRWIVCSVRGLRERCDVTCIQRRHLCNDPMQHLRRIFDVGKLRLLGHHLRTLRSWHCAEIDRICASHVLNRVVPWINDSNRAHEIPILH